VLLDFNRYGARVFGDLTHTDRGQEARDDSRRGRHPSAPIINTAIRGGRASITLGGTDVIRQEREREKMVTS